METGRNEITMIITDAKAYRKPDHEIDEMFIDR